MDSPMRIYYAARLHRQHDIETNKANLNLLRKWFKVFAPGEHGIIDEDDRAHIPDRWNEVFRMDLFGMQTADACLVYCDQEKMSEGALFEIGWLVANNKPVVVVTNGLWYPGLMVRQSCKVVQTLEEAIVYLKSLEAEPCYD